MIFRRLAIAVLASVAAMPLFANTIVERQPVAGLPINEIRIADPRRYWQQAGFKLMSPAIRVSVAAHSGAKTRIYLKLGDIAPVKLKSSDGGALQYPPGSEADRVSLVRFRSAGGLGYTVDDVRGTRWDRDGREWFHVYRASGPEPNAPLVGYEWLRDNPAAAREATRRLATIVSNTLLPNGYRSNRSDVRRFVRLNRCQSCHIANKPVATSVYDRGPPWATDAHGLFTPLAVLNDRAPLSAESAFHDPNAGDPYVRAWCGSQRANRLGGAGGYYFRCDDDSYPTGTRQINEADPYAASVCASRRYLFDHLDARGQRFYRPAMQACTSVPSG